MLSRQTLYWMGHPSRPCDLRSYVIFPIFALKKKKLPFVLASSYASNIDCSVRFYTPTPQRQSLCNLYNFHWVHDVSEACSQVLLSPHLNRGLQEPRFRVGQPREREASEYYCIEGQCLGTCGAVPILGSQKSAGDSWSSAGVSAGQQKWVGIESRRQGYYLHREQRGNWGRSTAVA